MAVIDCVFAVDDAYCQHLAAALASLIAHNKRHRLRLHIVQNGASERNLHRIKTFLADKTNVEAIFIELDSSNFAHLPVRLHLSLASYFRLFLPMIISPDVEKILYLDADLVVLSDLEPLWTTDLGSFAIAAVRDPFAESNLRLSLPPDNIEFNSGVLLINLKLWRDEGLQGDLVRYVEENEAILRYLDQDALNVVLRGRVKWLDYGWNFQARTTYSDVAGWWDRPTFRRTKRHPKIVHYTTQLKPWRYRDGVRFENEYLRYLEKTPWAGVGQPDKTPRAMLRRLKMRLLASARQAAPSPRKDRSTSSVIGSGATAALRRTRT